MDPNYMFEKALDLAKSAHRGQTSKDDTPFIIHPLTVMADPSLTTLELKIVALLHDVVEDTFYSVAYIRDVYGDVIADAIDAISHKDNEPRIDYWHRVNENTLAYLVKRADIKHNVSRLNLVPNLKDRQRMAVKYKEAMKFFCISLDPEAQTKLDLLVGE